MWTMDKDTLNAFVEELKAGAGAPSTPAVVDLANAGPDGNSQDSNYCEVKFKTTIPPFSYTTLMTVNDKNAFEKREPSRWTYKLWP